MTRGFLREFECVKFLKRSEAEELLLLIATAIALTGFVIMKKLFAKPPKWKMLSTFQLSCSVQKFANERACKVV